VAAGAISESRAGLTLLLAEVVITGFLLAKTPQLRFSARPNWRPLAIAASLGLALALVTGGGSLLRRFREPEALNVRREMLQSTLAMVRDRPLTGFGLGVWPEVYPRYAVMDPGRYVNHAHNDWAEWTAEGGVVLLVPFAALFGWACYAGSRCVWGLGVASVFLHAFIDFPLQKPALLAIAVVMMAAMSAHIGDLRRLKRAVAPVPRA
jgi:O-antigen ligase